MPASGWAQGGFTQEQHDRLLTMVTESPVFNRGFAGFALFDPAAHQFWFSHRADQYFTPASNTKLLTFFAASNLLRDSLPLLFYQDRGDTLQCWGTGYPLLLHPDFSEVDSLWRWLRGREEKVILFSAANWRDERFGPGWSWDDFPYGYQMEKAPLPLYGNAVRFSKQERLDSLLLQPAYFRQALVYEPTAAYTVSRLEDRNLFTFGPRAVASRRFERSIPFRYYPLLATQLLSDTLGRTVLLNHEPLPPPRQRQLLRQALPDTLYRRLLHDSDNFLAEQLLLLCSAERYGHLDSEQLLDYARDTLLRGLPEPIDWVDGSGLSRYNQFTPRSIVLILDQLHGLYPLDRLLSLFPAGGRSGTIANWYKGPGNIPYVFAKTGTLRHVHCLSGYLRTRSDRLLIFSFMINNYPGQLKDLKEEVQRVLEWVRING
jgi:D-alanyl-D-alanine carboxypeptidase/D-alanyl-D-alanine-endopeptidase (penicillin-binding protein 4)